VLKRIIDIILYGSILVSICSVALCIETNLLLHLGLNSLSFYLFVFGATLVQYNLHYLFKKTAVINSKRLAWSSDNKIYKILIGLGVVLILISLFSFQLHHFIILALFGAIAVLYSFPFLPFPNKKRIKDFGLLKIITLALLWTLVTVWFPIDGANISLLTFLLLFIRRFIFIFMLCLLFDIRDTEVDRLENISTLSVMLGIKKAYKLCFILLTVFAALSLVQFIYAPESVLLIPMLLSSAATFFIIQLSKKNNSDLVYLAGVDGMMLLQSLLVIFATLIYK
jgi:4-hydroxybenzoate polyprenyltransferase